jgi:ribosomal subunit interface protein
MQVPLEITHRGVAPRDYLDDLVRKRAEKLEEFCDRIIRCRVALERPNAHPKRGASWRVRIDMTIAGGGEIVIDRRPGDGTVRDDLYDAINDAFDAAQRRLKKTNEKQHGAVKLHPEQSIAGIVTKLFDEYGFIRAADGREIYFHAHSVLNDRFEDLELGMGVAYTEETGDMGPQASSLRVIDHRHGRRTSETELTSGAT